MRRSNTSDEKSNDISVHVSLTAGINVGRSPSRNSRIKQSLPSELVKVDNITKHSFWEELNYKLDVLVPTNEERELNVPIDSYLQQVYYGEKAKWRVIRNQDYNLPPYMTDHKEQETIYKVITQEKKFFGALELGSPFMKKWDALSLSLLLYTASLTPFETAFIFETHLNIDLRFLINYCVDLIFFYDMFVQMRTPYRDQITGKLVLDVKQISYAYLNSWFPLDIMSVLPFELIQYVVPSNNTEDLATLALLKFFRLTRLLKLLRIMRANRKLKQAQISSGMRYYSLELIKIVVTVIFLIHWFACGYRLVADQQSPTDPIGWLNTYALKTNSSIAIGDAYFASLYWSSSTLSLVGCQNPDISPTCTREYIYATIVQIIGFLIAIYYIARLSSMTNATSHVTQTQDVLVDNYLEMFDDLRLDPRLKFTVYQHLTDHFAEQANQRQADMLKQLPKSLRSFISTEIFLDFILHIPYLETFIDRQPLMIQEFCMVIEKKRIAANNFLFNEGMDGIYQIEEGIVAMEGVIYTTGSLIGLTVLRDRIKSVECRALTDIKCNYISRVALLEILDRYPKVKYYCKRWVQWQCLRDYIMAYTKLYFIAARRGALMNPPLYSRRPNMDENEDDDIDIAVLDHIEELGF